MNRLFISVVISLFISGCGGGSDADAVNDPTSDPISDPTSDQEPALGPFVSPATSETETAFKDTYISSNTANIVWDGPATYNPTNINSIAKAFNDARMSDPTVKEKLRMPQQTVWDSYNTSQKIIYLINSERSARGLRPFQGIDNDLVISSGNYAAELSADGVFSHNHGTFQNPRERLAGWAGVVGPLETGVANTTYNTYWVEELIHYTEVSPSSTIYEHEARAIYYFMYQDASPTIGGAYAHRKSLLTVNPVTESGQVSTGVVANARPIIGASSVEGMVSGNKRSTLVVHGVDPNARWGDFTSAPSLIGPESASDCLNGATFTESVNGAGINNSTCQ